MADQIKYVDSTRLQYLLGKLRDKNAELFLGKYSEAASAAKVKSTLTINGEAFDGSAAKVFSLSETGHKHVATDITDFTGAVQKVISDAGGTSHTHSNLATLNKIGEDSLTTWNNKIGADDVAKLKYSNVGMSGVADVKGALDILVKNAQINTAALTDTSANMNSLATKIGTLETDMGQAQTDIDALEAKVGDDTKGLVKDVADLKAANAEGGAVANAIADAKKAGTDAQTTANEAKAAVATEKTRAEGKEGELQTAIDTINNVDTGILAQAKTYADGKDAAIAAAKKAGDDAQADVNALAGKVGTVAEGKTVVELIATAQAQADKGVADAAAEATRAQGVEAGLRTDLGNKTDGASAEGSAFARIAQLKADLAAEVTRADTAEKANAAAAKAAQDDVNALEALVGDAADTADDATVYGAIAAEKARAIAAEGAVDEKAEANKAAIATLNGNDTVEGSVDKKIKDAIANVNTTTGGLDTRVGALETKVGNAGDTAKADGSLYARVAQNVKDIDAIEADYLKSTDRTALQNAINVEKGRLDAFMADADVSAQAVDTLKEIQAYITSDGKAATEMVNRIGANETAIAAINHETTGILAQAKADAAAKDETLHTAITEEIATAKQGAIDAASADADTKVNTAKTELQGKIDLKADQTALEAEVERAQGAEAANKAVLDKLDGDVNTDGSVKKQIETVRAALQANINAKVAQTDYNAKVAELEAADTALDSRLDALESGDNSVAAQVKVVADALDAHKKAQATKEKQVDDKLAVIQGEANVEGSIKKALADAKAYADTEDGKIEALLGGKEDAAAVDTAFGRIAKEVARATAAEEALGGRVGTLETKVGDASSGLVKDVADLKSIDAGTRLTAAETSIDNLEAWVAAHGTMTNTEIDEMLNTVYGTQA